jgi:hypothetical protein
LDGPRDAALREAWRLALSRDPDAQERALARDYLEGAVSGNDGPGQVRDAWAQLIQTLWATPEFRFLN